MKKLIYTFLSRPVTTGMFLLCIIILGISAVYNIPIELTPQVEFPRLSVSAGWQGVSPEAVEAFLTSPLEASLATIKGVKKISSRSSEGYCYIDLEFHPATNMDFARIEINEKLGAIKDELPYGISTPRISPYVPDDFKELQGFLTYTVSANRSANEIRKFVFENIRNSLLSIDGISDVSISGGNDRQINITIDYEIAKSLGITNEEISTAVDEAERILSAGKIRFSNFQYSIRIFNTIENLNILEEQPVKVLANGSVIRIKDIGKVVDGYEAPTSFYRINGKESVTVEISKEPGANTIETANSVFERMESIGKTIPIGYVISKEIDKSERIREELNELYSNAFYSFIIIIVVLFLIFRKIRYSFIIILSIIFSLMLSFLLFYVFAISINILTLSSITLGFGLIVDNSIVVVDYIDRKYNGQNLKRLSVVIKEIFFPVFASTLTTVAVFIPLVFLTGELRLYFSQFALATIFTVSSSLLVSFTIVPLFIIKFAFNNKNKNGSKENEILFSAYSFLLTKMIRWKKLSIIILVLLIGLPVWLIPRRIDPEKGETFLSSLYNSVFDSEFYGDIKKYVDYAFGGSMNLFFNHISKGEIWSYGEETYLSVRLELANGNEIERINSLTKDFEKEILAYRKNFKTITSRVLNEEVAYIKIDFTEKQSQTAFPYMLKNYLTAYAVQLGGLDVSVSGFGPGFYSGGGYASSSFNVKIMGFNYERVKKIAEDFAILIKRNPRIDNVDIDKSYLWGLNSETYEIAGIVNRDNLIRHNITINNLLETVAKNTSGNLSYNRFRMGNEEINYEIKFSNYKNIQLAELANLIIKDPKGDNAKIKDVIEFQERKVLSSINREERQYVRYVAFEYKGPYMYGNEYVEKTISQVKVPEGYKLEKEGFAFFMNEEEELEIWKILVAAVVLIFMISAGLFESFKKPFLVLFAVPFAFIGTIFLFFYGDYSMDRGAYAGILLLIGLSVNNSIILIDYVSKHVRNKDPQEIIKYSYNRIRPIFTTTVTTVAALLPLILSTKEGFWKSLSLSVAGGITLSAIIVVIYLPVLYSILNKRKIQNDNLKTLQKY